MGSSWGHSVPAYSPPHAGPGQALEAMQMSYSLCNCPERIIVGSPLLRCNIHHSQVVGALTCKVPVDEGNPHYVGNEDLVGSTLVLHLLTSDLPIFDSNAILNDDSVRHSELSLPRLVVLVETDNVGFCW